MNIKASYGISPALTAGITLADKSKGSVGNRIDCAKAQATNTLKTSAKCVGAGVAIGGLSGAAAFTKTGNKLVGKAMTAVKNFSENNTTAKKIVSSSKDLLGKAAAKFKSLPGPAKVATAAGLALATLVGTSLGKEHAFKAGQIDQKYTDKAQLQQTLDA